MSVTQFNIDLLEFIHQSPTPFHAAAQIRHRLIDAGFTPISEADSWQLEVGQRYVLTRNDSSVIGFIYGKQDILESGIRLLAAHTDSPCLRVKPNADVMSSGYWQLGVEVYGGVLLNPWFDRELGLAGRVSLLDVHGELKHVLINFNQAIGMIPSLAIHLDREVNKSRSINPQKDLPVLLGIDRKSEYADFSSFLLHQVEVQYPEVDALKVLDFEMSFYDIQPGSVYGIYNDFIASARLDNLLSCFVGMQSLLESDGEQSCLLICTDHEEVGSASAAGADGTLLSSFLQRLLPDVQNLQRVIAKSMLISADNAHGVHPNFSEKHEAKHGPLLNAGPVIKVNASHRYASTSETQAIFRALCDEHNVPVQTFVVRADMACGSTVGPIIASNIGVKTIDVGVPTFAMHSIRETAGTKDAWYLYQVINQFFQLNKV